MLRITESISEKKSERKSETSNEIRDQNTSARREWQKTAKFAAVLTVTTLGYSGAAWAADWQVSRTPDGQPDLQGVWANNTITPVERPDEYGDREFLSDEEIQFLGRRIQEITEEDGDALFGNGVFTAAVTGEVKSYDPTTGNYDQSWLAARQVHGRTSQIIDPPNGKYPERTAAGIAKREEMAMRRNRPAETWVDRGLSERCLSYSAPYLGSGYNSYWQIVQSENHVTIIQEMIHDVRVIPLVASAADINHIDDKVRLWHGDSKGYFDGDTLVIETSNYSDASSNGLDSSKKKIVERISRRSDSELHYVATFDDPSFAAPYTRELIFDESPDPIYEYACHEGNYGMENILSGARVQERMAEEGR